MKKIYVTCSLTQAPGDFLEFVDKVKKKLSQYYEVLDFVGLEKGTSKDVYEHDLRCVLLSDIFVAICDYPAIGLGYEMSLALEKYSKPTIAFYRYGNKITRLVLGINHPMFTLKEYNSEEDILNFLKEKELKHFKEGSYSDVCDSDVCKV